MKNIENSITLSPTEAVRLDIGTSEKVKCKTKGRHCFRYDDTPSIIYKTGIEVFSGQVYDLGPDRLSDEEFKLQQSYFDNL